MEYFLNKIRTPDKTLKTSKKIINTILIFLLGIVLGVFSKWLDNLTIFDTIWWQHILGKTDLRNVFSCFGIWIFLATAVSVYSKTPIRAGLNVFLFFVGMTVSYHLYTIMFSGFNPKSYMLIWYVITAITPILSFVCWYAKGNGVISVSISAAITAVMLMESFGVGLWYFDFKSIVDTLLFLGTLTVLYTKPKNSVFGLLFAVIFVMVYNLVN